MGIYPHKTTKDHVRHEDGSETWTEVLDPMDGSIRTRKITAEAPLIVWENCFCCSCGDREGSDHACRNHGSGHGERPCDEHGTKGSEWTEEVGGGGMPESVQVERNRLKSLGVILP